MLKKSQWFLFSLLAVCISFSAFAQDNGKVRAIEVLEKIDDLWRASSSTARLQMEVRTEHYTRTMVMDSWSKGKEKSLVSIVMPLKEKGTVSLKNGNTMYTYLPKTDRVIRLTSGMMMGSWMGSHFTNDDLVKESRLSDDYVPEITFEGVRDGKEIIEFALQPKTDAPVVWGKIIISVLASDYLPIDSLYFDEDMVLARTLTFRDIKEMGGRMIPAVLHMVPADKPDEYTELVYQQIEFDIDLQDSLFSLDAASQDVKCDAAVELGIQECASLPTPDLGDSPGHGLCRGIMIFYASLVEGWLGAMETNAISMEMGEMQIHARGYRTDPDLYTVIPDYPSVVQQAESFGLITSARLLGGGLAAAHENSTGVSIRGIDPETEKQVVLLQNHVFSGTWLTTTGSKQVVLGNQLARILDVQPGSEIVLVGQAADGSMANDLFTVQGVLKSVGQGIDRGGLIMGDKDFREFFALPEGVHEIVLKRTDSFIPLDQSVMELETAFSDLEVLSWRQLQPTLAKLLDLSDVSMIIMLMITYAAVGMLTMNAMLMGVFERIPVFGVMKAVGFSGLRLFVLIFCETFVLVSMASLLAFVVGAPLSYTFEDHPIDFSFLLSESSTIAGIAFEPQWYCVVTTNSVVMPLLFLFIIALLFYTLSRIKGGKDQSRGSNSS